MKTDLVSMKLDRATQLLADASTIQEARHIISLALAAQVYARQQQLGDEAKRYAKAIEIRAKRKLGNILKQTPKNKGTAGIGRPNLGGTQTEPPKRKLDNLPTYKQIKLDKKLAAKAQKLAEVPERRFDQFLARDKKLDDSTLLRDEKIKAENWNRKLQRAKRRWNLRKMLAIINSAVNQVQREWNLSCPPDEDRAKIAACLDDHARTWKSEIRFETCGIAL